MWVYATERKDIVNGMGVLNAKAVMRGEEEC